MKTRTLVFERSDGKARVTFVDRGGIYSFDEERECDDEIPGIGPYTYWSPTYASGLYDDPRTAEREAKAVIVWLREVEIRWPSDG